jgi:sirohydrochlorin ferrochelatase
MPIALLLVDHGSRFSSANQVLDDLVALLRRLRPDLIVHAAHMELASPSIPEGLAACAAAGASEIVVHPYMLAPGRHASEDIPRMVKEATRDLKGVTCRVTTPLGVHQKLAEIILERAGL